jgi:sugar phosphate permease
MGASSFLTAFLVINLLQGLAQSCGWAPLAKNLSCWFSRRERGQVLGWWSTNYAAGSVVAFALAGAAIAWFGHWSYAFYVPAACLFIVFLLFYFFHVDRPQDVGLPSIDTYHGELGNSTQHSEEEATESTNWLELIKQPMIGLLATTYFLLKPTRYAILLWGPYYVTLRLQSGALFSATITTSFAIAGIFGAIVAGTVSDKLFKSKRMPFTVICLITLSGILFVFDGLISQTVATVNKAQLTTLSTQLENLSSEHDDMTLQSVGTDLALLAGQTSLSTPDAVAQLRDAVAQLKNINLQSIEGQVSIRTIVIQLRKVVRSEQFLLFRPADIYKDRISKIDRRCASLGIDKDDPLFVSLSSILKIKRLEISATVDRLSQVQNYLDSLAQERPDLRSDLTQMSSEIRQMRVDITDYLEDRGDDMSFVYQAQLVDLIEDMSRAQTPYDLTTRLNKLNDAATLLDSDNSAIDRELTEIKTLAAELSDTELALRVVDWATALEFDRIYQPLRPPEEMTLAYWIMVLCLFLIGFFLYAPDSQISTAAAIDFGHHKGASSSAGFINGCGSISAIFGGAGVGFIAQAYGWSILFTVFASMTLLAALILLPKWNVVPTAETE